jgi:NADH dehydrogenase [ubiquinone] 1 alpha subcomplex assembly factor 6
MGLSYCGETVRNNDSDRFLLSLFAPPGRREALWALYAFNYEIAKTREVVTETKLGLIRLQWWREALAGIYAGGAAPKHQVLEPLAEAIRAFGLPQDLFETLIYAREFDLEDKLPATLEGMAHYADYTSTPLLRLGLRIAGQQAEEEAAQRVGTAYALAGLLRATPLHLRQRRCYLPEDLLHKAGTDQYDLFEGKNAGKTRPVVEAVVALAEEKLKAFHAKVPRHVRLAAKLAAIHLARIKGAGYDVFAPVLQVPPHLLALRLWWHSLGN